MDTRQTIPSVNSSLFVPVMVGMLLPAVQQVRHAARKATSMNNLKQQALAVLNFESAYGRFPAAYSVDEDGKQLLSWRVHLLPYIEGGNLYDQFHLDEPWDSEHNIKLLDQMPETFASPLTSLPPGKTTYRAVGGEDGVFVPPIKGFRSPVKFSSIHDGSSNTLMIIETGDRLAIQWTKPDPGLDPEHLDRDSLFGALPEGVSAAFVDGAVYNVSRWIDLGILQQLMKKSDGSIVDPNALDN